MAAIISAVYPAYSLINSLAALKSWYGSASRMLQHSDEAWNVVCCPKRHKHPIFNGRRFVDNKGAISGIRISLPSTLEVD